MFDKGMQWGSVPRTQRSRRMEVERGRGEMVTCAPAQKASTGACPGAHPIAAGVGKGSPTVCRENQRGVADSPDYASGFNIQLQLVIFTQPCSEMYPC